MARHEGWPGRVVRCHPTRPAPLTHEDADIARVEALARVRYLLQDLGCPDEDIDRAVEDDVLDLLVVDRVLVPAGHRLTQSEVAERTDIPLEVAKRFWRALGFLDVADDDAAFTDMDIQAVQIFQSLVALDIVDARHARCRWPGSSARRWPGSPRPRRPRHHADPHDRRVTACSTPTSSPVGRRRPYRPWRGSSSTCGGATCRPPHAGPCSCGAAGPTRGCDR